MRLIRILTFSNFWIAIGAVAMCQSGYLFLGHEPIWDLLALFCLLACWSVYLLIRVAALQRIRTYDRTHRWRFFLDHIRMIRALTIAGLVVVAVLFFLLPRPVQTILLLPGIISLIYGLPFSAGGKRLRDIGIIKIFLIAFVWAITGSFLPAAAAGMDVFSLQTGLLFASGFLFIFGITLPFDIKDLEVDAIHEVRTIPYYLGTESTYTFSFICLFLAGAIHLVWFPETGVPAGVSMLLSGILVYLSGRIRHDQIYFFGLDSMMLLQFLLVWTYLLWG